MSDTERDLEVAAILGEAMRVAISLRDRPVSDEPAPVGRAGVLLVDHLNAALQTLLEHRLRQHGLSFGTMSFFDLLPLLRAAENGGPDATAPSG
jgi:hypothetical protein